MSDMDPQDAFLKFIKAAGADPRPALAFFVGYAHGANSVGKNIDQLVEAFTAALNTTNKE